MSDTSDTSENSSNDDQFETLDFNDIAEQLSIIDRKIEKVNKLAEKRYLNLDKKLDTVISSLNSLITIIASQSLNRVGEIKSSEISCYGNGIAAYPHKKKEQKIINERNNVSSRTRDYVDYMKILWEKYKNKYPSDSSFGSVRYNVFRKVHKKKYWNDVPSHRQDELMKSGELDGDWDEFHKQVLKKLRDKGVPSGLVGGL